MKNKVEVAALEAFLASDEAAQISGMVRNLIFSHQPTGNRSTDVSNDAAAAAAAWIADSSDAVK